MTCPVSNIPSRQRPLPRTCDASRIPFWRGTLCLLALLLGLAGCSSDQASRSANVRDPLPGVDASSSRPDAQPDAHPDADAFVVGDANGDGPPTDAADAHETPQAPARFTRTIGTAEVRVDAIIDVPAAREVDAWVVYHGTVGQDGRVMEATRKTLEQFQALLDRPDVLIVSVAYLEEGLLFGDNFPQAEAALLWVKQSAAEELGLTIKRVFLGGHSQGGYHVTRLNHLHEVDGVVANAPGPLDLGYRCELEERREIEASVPCASLRDAYGSTTANPEAYAARSLLSFTSTQRSPALFVQGMADADVQLRSWPMFRAQLEACTGCAPLTFVELPGLGHPALFVSPDGKAALQAFLQSL